MQLMLELRNARERQTRKRASGLGGGVSRSRCSRFEPEGGLQARLCSAGDADVLKLAPTELRTDRFERVVAGFERGKVKCAVLRGDGVGLRAGSLVAQDKRDTGKGRRMHIVRRPASEPVRGDAIWTARDAARLELAAIGTGHAADADNTTAPNAKPSNPGPPCLCHCPALLGRSWEKVSCESGTLWRRVRAGQTRYSFLLLR